MAFCPASSDTGACLPFDLTAYPHNNMTVLQVIRTAETMRVQPRPRAIICVVWWPRSGFVLDRRAAAE